MKSKKEMVLEYVMSGMSMVRVADMNDKAKVIINEFLKDSEYNISFLFNAFTEARLGEIHIGKNFPEAYSIHADSGGLQITTLGLPIHEVRQKHKEIYKRQAEWSDIAMSFDEMAVRQIDLNSSVLSYSSRLFVRELCKPMAHNTANNIKEQIEAFDKYESDAKIMLICQGNDKDSYREYAEIIFDDLDEYERTRIHGIAPSSASIGNGALEIAEMLYSMRELQLPDEIKENVHLLGVGSANQLAPILYSPEYFSFVKHLSFDSTSASRRYTLDGQVFYVHRMLKDGKPGYYQPKYQEIIDRYKKYFNMVDGFEDMDITDFVDKATFYSKNNSKKIWSYIDRKDPISVTLSTLLAFFVTVKYVEEMFEDMEDMTKEDKPIYKDIKCWDDWEKNRTNMRLYYNLRTNGVQSISTEEALENLKKKKQIIQSIF